MSHIYSLLTTPPRLVSTTIVVPLRGTNWNSRDRNRPSFYPWCSCEDMVCQCTDATGQEAAQNFERSGLGHIGASGLAHQSILRTAPCSLWTKDFQRP